MVKKILSFLIVTIMVCTIFMISACGREDGGIENESNTSDELSNHELNEKEQAALDFILENVQGVIPKYTKYEYAGSVEVDGYDCVRFEFFSDEMYVGAFAKALEDEAIFWDAGYNGNYMYMKYDNGWYVTGNYVNAPVTEEYSQVYASKEQLDDGISGQYTSNLGSFYVTMYDDDYAGEPDGFFRAAGNAKNENGEDVAYSLAGEFYLSKEETSGTYADEEGESEEVFEYSAVYVYTGNNGETMKFMLGDKSIFIIDAGTHNGEKFNLTGNYLLDFYY